jgi:hypothetical protein
MGTALPQDEVLIDTALVAEMIATFNSVSIVAQYVNVHGRERFPDTDEEDADLSSIPDLLVPTRRRTSIIQIGIPTVEELEYTGDACTQLNFVYPMTFDLETVDFWDDPTLPFSNSRDLAMAVYMKSRRAFKANRTFGYENCVHLYLQQEHATSTPTDEESGGQLHVADWSLTVQCMGILV